ncbi:MAG: hypothetical protein ACRD5D_08035, partial [Candidatus Polarisedimenticolia bacterium]
MSKRRKGTGRRSRKPILADSQLAAATARASASIKNTLSEEPGLFPEDPLEGAADDPLLAEEEDEAAMGEDDEEDELFLGPPPVRPRLRGRPAPSIVVKTPPKGSARTGAAGAPRPGG